MNMQYDIELSDAELELISGGCHRACHRDWHHEDDNVNYQETNVRSSYTYGEGALIGNITLCGNSINVLGRGGIGNNTY